jgi:predicted metal-dependent phosphoesterase TrpH
LLIDLHVHTTLGSTDSNLHPEALVAEATRAGLDAVCVTEHSGVWSDSQLEEIGNGSIRLFRGREIETEMGHVLAIGMPGFPNGMHRIKQLAEYCDETGAALIAAHPFRHHVNPPVGQSCLLTRGADLASADPAAITDALPNLSLFDAIEAFNGATTPVDNDVAVQVAEYLDTPTTGGSDAHSIEGLGSCATQIDGDVRSTQELVEAIRSGAIVGMARNGSSRS